MNLVIGYGTFSKWANEIELMLLKLVVFGLSTEGSESVYNDINSVGKILQSVYRTFVEGNQIDQEPFEYFNAIETGKELVNWVITKQTDNPN